MSKIVVSSIEGLPEHVTANAVELDDGGGYEIEVDLADHSKLHSALREERKRAAELKAKLSTVDVEEYERLRTEAAEREQRAEAERQKVIEEQARRDGDMEKLKAQWAETRQKFEADAAKERDRLLAEIRRVSISEAASRAIGEAGGNVRLLLPHAEQRLRVEEASGTFQVRVIDGEGNTVFDDDGSPATVKGLVERMRADKDFAFAFSGTGRGGSARTESVSQPGVRTIPRGDDPLFYERHHKDIAAGKVVVAG